MRPPRPPGHTHAARQKTALYSRSRPGSASNQSNAPIKEPIQEPTERATRTTESKQPIKCANQMGQSKSQSKSRRKGQRGQPNQTESKRATRVINSRRVIVQHVPICFHLPCHYPLCPRHYYIMYHLFRLSGETCVPRACPLPPPRARLMGKLVALSTLQGSTNGLDQWDRPMGSANGIGQWDRLV